jgi:cytidine deaminase
MKPQRLIDMAIGVALGRLRQKQIYRLGAVGIRDDGVIVASFNGCPTEVEWAHHAESRLCRKLTPESIVAVARVLASGVVAMAKPCASCRRCMERVGVKRVYYTIAPNEFGVIVF